MERLGKEMAYLVSRAFLYGLEGKELAIWRLIAMGYKYGGEVVHMLGEEAVSQVQHMVRAVGNEAHLQLEFLRFSQYEGPINRALYTAADVGAFLPPLFGGAVSYP